MFSLYFVKNTMIASKENKENKYLPNPENYIFYDYTKYYKDFNSQSVLQNIVKCLPMLTVF